MPMLSFQEIEQIFFAPEKTTKHHTNFLVESKSMRHGAEGGKKGSRNWRLQPAWELSSIFVEVFFAVFASRNFLRLAPCEHFFQKSFASSFLTMAKEKDGWGCFFLSRCILY